MALNWIAGSRLELKFCRSMCIKEYIVSIFFLCAFFLCVYYATILSGLNPVFVQVLVYVHKGLFHVHFFFFWVVLS